jgi:hypothetical protein
MTTPRTYSKNLWDEPAPIAPRADPLADAWTRPWPPSMDDPCTPVEVVAEAARHFAESECEVENDRGQVDWERTIERVEEWYHLHLPVDGDDERYKVIRREVRKARKAEG